MLAWEVTTQHGVALVWANSRKRDSSGSAQAIKNSLSAEHERLLGHGVKSLDEFTQEIVEADSENTGLWMVVVLELLAARLPARECNKPSFFGDYSA